MIYALIFPYTLLVAWLIFSINYIRKARVDISKINDHLLELIPSTFTTIGVLGTFIGIAAGLRRFNVQNIDASICPVLK